MILDGNGGMDKSKKENIYLALFLMFLEFITLKKENQSYPASFLIQRGQVYVVFFFIHLSTSLITMNELYQLLR